MGRRAVMAFGGAALLASGLGVGTALFRDQAPPRQAPATSAGNEDVRIGCQVDGGDVIVPSVVGKPLGDAITAARARGLLVVDSGVRPGDPSDVSAIVRAQKPQAGMRVPFGACIGFRTGT